MKQDPLKLNIKLPINRRPSGTQRWKNKTQLCERDEVFSNSLQNVMTNVSLLKQPQRSFELKRKLLVKKTKNIQSKGRLAANSNDADYLLGCGVGGYDN